MIICYFLYITIFSIFKQQHFHIISIYACNGNLLQQAGALNYSKKSLTHSPNSVTLQSVGALHFKVLNFKALNQPK